MDTITISSATWIVLAPLVVAALSLIVWELLWPDSGEALGLYIAAGGIALALSAALRPVLADVGVSAPEAVDRLACLVRLVFLGAGALALLVDGVTPWSSLSRERIWRALNLLALAGGILSLSASDLGTLWVGLVLYSLTSGLVESSHSACPRDVLSRTLGLSIMLLGVGLVYASMGSLRVGQIGRVLWTYSGPRPAMLYAGLASAVAGLCAALRLLPSYGPPRSSDDARSPILGTAILARIALQGSAALAWEWFWLFHALAAVSLVWAGAASLWRGDRVMRLGRLVFAQRGVLLWSLVFAFTPVGLEAWVTAATGFVLAQTLVSTGLLQVSAAHATGQVAPIVGLARHSPWVGIPLLVGVMSMAALPMTLGSTGRAMMILAASEHFSPWAAWIGFGGSLVLALLYLPTLLALLRRGSRRSSVHAPRWAVVAMALMACALIVLGALAGPLQRAAAWVFAA